MTLSSLRRYLSVSLVFSLLLANAVFAASLTNRQIESFLNSLEALNEQMPDMESEFDAEPDFDDENFDIEAYYAKLAEEMSSLINEFDATKMATLSVNEIKGTEHFDLFKRIIAQHGFRTPEDWAALGDRIFAAYFALEMQQQFSAEGFSAEELAMMQALMGSMMAGLDEIPKDDVRAITPFLERLQELMNNDEDDYDYWDDY